MCPLQAHTPQTQLVREREASRQRVRELEEQLADMEESRALLAEQVRCGMFL